MSEPADLVVVGAGPAGMAAAVTALAGGLRVALVDSGTAVGGQYWRHPPEHARTAVPTEDLHHGLRRYRALCAALSAGRADGRLDLRLAHHAWSAVRGDDGFAVHAVDRRAAPQETAVVLRAPRLLVATGAYDRQLPFPGWDLPGVLTIGGLQALLKGGCVAAGSRVALGGTGPFLLPVAAGLAARGVEVVTVCEAAHPGAWLRHPGPLLRNPGKWAEGAGYAATLARHRVPVRPRTAIVAAEGRERVTSVRIASLAPDGSPRPGTERRVEADAVGVGWGFAPQLDLLVPLGCSLTDSADGNAVVAVDGGQRTTVPGVYAAGETCGIGGAALAVHEGRLAARSVLADSRAALGGDPATRLRPGDGPGPPDPSGLVLVADRHDRRVPLRGGDRRCDPGRPRRRRPRPPAGQAVDPGRDGLVPGADVRARRALPHGTGTGVRARGTARRDARHPRGARRPRRGTAGIGGPR